MVSERLSCVHIAYVQFHKRYIHTRQCIPDSYRGMCESGGIDDDAVDTVSARVLDAIDYGTFVVGLKMRHLDAEGRCAIFHRRLDLREGGRAIDLWLTCAEEVQVWPVDEEDLLLLGSSHCVVMELESTAFEELAVEAEYTLDADEATSVSCFLAGGSRCCL